MFKTGEAAALSSAKSLLGNLQREAKAMAPLPLPMSKALTSFFPYPKCALTMMPADPAASLLKLVVEGQRTSEVRQRYATSYAILEKNILYLTNNHFTCFSF